MVTLFDATTVRHFFSIWKTNLLLLHCVWKSGTNCERQDRLTVRCNILWLSLLWFVQWLYVSTTTLDKHGASAIKLHKFILKLHKPNEESIDHDTPVLLLLFFERTLGHDSTAALPIFYLTVWKVVFLVQCLELRMMIGNASDPMRKINWGQSTSTSWSEVQLIMHGVAWLLE